MAILAFKFADRDRAGSKQPAQQNYTTGFGVMQKALFKNFTLFLQFPSLSPQQFVCKFELA